MTQEDVIKGLECCLDALVQSEHVIAENGVVMSSWQDRAKRIDAIREAIAFLKAQEPREPHYTKLEYIVNGMPVAINHPECPRCYDNGLVLWDAEIEKGAAYCKRCGQAVKWDG